MKKKYLAFVLAICLTATLTLCGYGGEYTLTDETITLTGGLEQVLTVTTDGKLVVKTVASPTEDFFKVGDVIAIK